MPWPWTTKRDDKDGTAATTTASSSPSQPPEYWADSMNKTDWKHYTDFTNWIPTALAVTAALGFSAFYRSYLRRIPTTNYIQPRFFRKRSLLGKVTSVGDGDNFHLFHTPGGRLAGWGWLRQVPTSRKELKGKTIPVRIAGVDAPEGAHFGRQAQPFSGEALEFLTQYVLGRRVRAYLFRKDQYDRVVARVLVRRYVFFQKDVGIEMLKRGLATCYEAKTGVEFGGHEVQYRAAEAKAKAQKLGIWSQGTSKHAFESPREYKTRVAAEEAAAASTPGASRASKTTSSGHSKTSASKPASGKSHWGSWNK